MTYKQAGVTEYATICALRERFSGNLEGVSELSRLLVSRQAELEDKIKQQNAVREEDLQHGN